jgi:hypothetical protein
MTSTQGSLNNTDAKPQFALKNRLSDAEVTAPQTRVWIRSHASVQDLLLFATGVFLS